MAFVKPTAALEKELQTDTGHSASLLPQDTSWKAVCKD